MLYEVITPTALYILEQEIAAAPAPTTTTFNSSNFLPMISQARNNFV